MEADGRSPKELRIGLLRALRTTVFLGTIVGLCVGLVAMQLTSEPSKPFTILIGVVLLVLVVSEVGSRLYLPTLFAEPSMVEEMK